MRLPSLVRAAVVVAAAICGTVPTRAVRAQVLELPEARQGYFLSVGPHFTMSKVWMDNERYGVWPGYEVGLHFGQMVTRRFGLGLQVHTGAGKGDAQTAV